MPSISLTDTTPNSTSDANANLNNNWTLIENLLNGGLDASNLADASVGTSEIADASVTPVKLAVQPSARVYHDTTQSIGNVVDQTVVFNSERYDQDGLGGSTIHSTSADTGRLTCRVAGVYEIGFEALFASNAAGIRQAKLALNAGLWIAFGQVVGAGTDNFGCVQVHTTYKLAVNDYVTATVFQNSGGALNLANHNNYSPEFWMHRVSP